MYIPVKQALAISSLLFLLLIQGCVGVEPYHTTPSAAESESGFKKEPIQDVDVLNCEPTSTCLLFAEYDGFGRMFNRSQLSQIVKTANGVASREGTIVVFVHGWHHNAKSDDKNLDSFKLLLQNARKVQETDESILGIYVGWPGESVTLEPFSTLTFWERKNTAHSVGNGEIFELFSQLSRIRQQNPKAKLVIIGHSFGGAVSYTALANKITEQILQDPPRNSLGAGASPPWDLLVLVNPAFEAMRVRSQMAAARSRNYADTQIPHVVFITTEADAATRLAFKAGRFFSTFFDRYADDDGSGSALNNTAIGHYEPYVTHQLALAKPEGCVVKSPDKANNETQLVRTLASGRTENACFNDPNKLPVLDGAKPLELIRCDRPNQCNRVTDDAHFLEKGDALQGYVPYNLPIMNIRATGEVMNGHNDIWNNTMHSFLTQLVVQMIKYPGVLPLVKPPVKVFE